MFETHVGNLDTMRMLANRLARPRLTGSPFVTVYRTLPNDTDFTIFSRAGWTGLNFAFIDDLYCYHTAEDNLAHLSLRSLQHHGEHALALARFIAQHDQLDLAASTQDAVFFDLLGWHVLVYPASWAWPLALVPLTVLVVRFGGPLRSAPFRWVLARVAMASLLAIVAASALGEVARRVFVATGLAGGIPGPWRDLLAVPFVPLSLIVLGAAARCCVGKLAARDIWSAFWILWSLAGLLTALLQPGFSHIFLVPGLAAAAVAIVPLTLPPRVVLTTLVAGIVWLPLANLLPVALGAHAAVIFHPVFVVLWLPLLPLLAGSASSREKKQLNHPPAADTRENAR
jgi:hypothetical protein